MTNVETKEKTILTENYPSIELAYPIAVASYDSVIKRIDALDGRIQTLTTVAVTIAFAIPIFGRTQNSILNSFWFVEGVFCLAVAIFVATYARFNGTITVLDPINLYQNTLHLPPDQFQVDIIHAAAQAYKHNKRVLEYRWKLAVFSTLIFACSLLMLAVWATGRST